MRRLPRMPLIGWFAMTVVLLYAITAIFAPLIAPWGESEIVGKSYLPMGGEFLLGTDQIGRDLFSRLVYGARNTIQIVLITTLLSFLIGSTLGMLAALKPGLIDQGISRVVDIILAVPALIFSLILLAVFGSSVLNLILILAILDSTRVYRLSRSLALNVVAMDYIEAAKMRGEGPLWIIFKEVWPNVRRLMLTEFGLRFCFVFLTISALSFLGVGIQPPTADWGSMIAENKTLIIYGNPAPLLPATAIALLTVCINLVVDIALNPKKEGGK